MQKTKITNYGNFLLSLSDAIDLANPEIAQHQQRTAYIAWEISRQANLSSEMINDIFIASLFHDVGAITIEEKTMLHNFETDNLFKHCLRGELLLKRIPSFDIISQIVKYHHKKWSDWDESLETCYVISSQILELSDYIERLINRKKYILHQTDNILDYVKNSSSKMIHPKIIEYFMEISKREDFWLNLISSKLFSILNLSVPLNLIEIEISEIEKMSNVQGKQ